jgi:hypothetical protein
LDSDLEIDQQDAPLAPALLGMLLEAAGYAVVVAIAALAAALIGM